jgi:hypothetical protein
MDVVGRTFRHPVVKQMTFRFEDKTGVVKNLPRSGTDTSPYSSAWAKCAAGAGESDVPGHVINARWNGPGTLPREEGFEPFQGDAPFLNLVPLQKDVNDNGAYNAQERQVHKWRFQYQVLCVRISFMYSPSSDHPARPTKFKWEYLWQDDNGKWGGSEANTVWLDNPL